MIIIRPIITFIVITFISIAIVVLEANVTQLRCYRPNNFAVPIFKDSEK